MSDGRGVNTSYIPSCELNYNIQEKYNIKDTHDFRYFLQQNSEKIKQDNDSKPIETCKTCPVCSESLTYLPKDGHLGRSNSMMTNVIPIDLSVDLASVNF